MQMKIHTKGIVGSRTIDPGEEAGALFAGILEIDGEVYDRVSDISLKAGEEFATITVTFIPGKIDVVCHDEDSWQKLCQEGDARDRRAAIRRSDGSLIAVYVPPRPKDDS